MDLFANKQYTQAHAFANIFEMSVKARRTLSVSLTSVVYVSLGETPLESLAQ